MFKGVTPALLYKIKWGLDVNSVLNQEKNNLLFSLKSNWSSYQMSGAGFLYSPLCGYPAGVLPYLRSSLH